MYCKFLDEVYKKLAGVSRRGVGSHVKGLSASIQDSLLLHLFEVR